MYYIFIYRGFRSTSQNDQFDVLRMVDQMNFSYIGQPEPIRLETLIGPGLVRFDIDVWRGADKWPDSLPAHHGSLSAEYIF